MTPRAADQEGPIRAAGGVLWRPARDRARTSAPPEIALVHRSRYDDWSLPKGKLEAGEHPIEGACREVLEETGIRPTLGPSLGSVSYVVAGQGPKVVEYWAMRAATGEFVAGAPGDDFVAGAPGDDFVANDEADALRWVPPGEAAATYWHDTEVLRQFSALPPITGTVLLVRHGHAGDRRTWQGEDGLRPLDLPGEAQALAISRVLPWYAPQRVLSADPVRCVQTVEPLAGVVGAAIEVDERLSEAGHRRSPEAAAALVRELGREGTVCAVSSQGGVIPAVVEALAKADGVRLDKLASAKGSLWSLFFAGTTLVAAEYYRSLDARHDDARPGHPRER